MTQIKVLSCDVLVVGSGAAGLRAAIEAFEHKADVLIVGKCVFGNAHTRLAAGGINAALANADEKDNWLVHAADTFEEGGKIGNPKMIETLAKNAPAAISELASFGVDFAKYSDGRIMQRVYGAQTFPRTCFVGDYTGRAIMQALVRKSKRLGIRQLDFVYVTGLLRKGHRVVGCFGVDLRKGRFLVLRAKAVVLAMGGYSRIYSNSSSRPFESIGFGSFLALKNGLSLVDMEMVQFHPTGMTWPRAAQGKLVTEAVRSEGGILLNANGERFMKKYSPKELELSARDVVARAIFFEILAGRGTKNNGVWLDLTHIPKELILKRLPDTFKQFKKFQGLDISKKKMEVAPTAHYSMGGIEVNPVDCSTGLNGLFAVGEVTGGLHGGNRLGGNSLAETIVFGKIAGKNAFDFAKKSLLLEAEKKQVGVFCGQIKSFFKKGLFSPKKLRSELQGIMWEHAGAIRDAKSLKTGLKKIELLEKKLKQMGVCGPLKKNDSLVFALDTTALVLVAKTIIKSALCRAESRAAHCRTDSKKTLKKWQANIFCALKNGKIVVSKKPVPSGFELFEGEIKKKRPKMHGLLEC